MRSEDSFEFIRLSKSSIGAAEKQAVLEVLDAEFLGMGAKVHEFEAKLSHFFSREVTCVSTGTAALQLALQACGVGPGDEVLVQSLTYVASFQAIAATGATPIACDVLVDTLTIDLGDAKKKLSSRTKAIMPVHYSGAVGNLTSILEFATDHKLRVIEDAAHAFGTVFDGSLVGSFGDITCFSFDGIKNITSGEGGCVVSSDTAVTSKVKDARLLGVQNDSEKRFAGVRSWEFDVVDQGWRYHMSDLMAAIGIVQLGRFDEFSAKRKALAQRYSDQLSNQSFVKLFDFDYGTITPHIFPVRVSAAHRQIVRSLLLADGIQTGIHYLPNHKLSYFSEPISANQLPITEKIFPELLTLPLHPDLSLEQVDYVAERLTNHLSEVANESAFKQ